MKNFNRYVKVLGVHFFIVTILMINGACSKAEKSTESAVNQNAIVESSEEAVAQIAVAEPQGVTVQSLPNAVENNGIKVIEAYENKVPENIPFVKKYGGELPDKINYGIVMSETANLREDPTTNSRLVKTLKFYERVELLEKIEFKESQWYKVKTSDNEIGYLFTQYVKERNFQFGKGIEKITEVENFVETARENKEKLVLVNAYTPDSDNKFLSKNQDKYGRYKIQSATGVYNGEEFYIPDRSIGKIVENDGIKEKVKVEAMSEPYIGIDDKSLVVAERLETNPINKAIVIDIENQNLTLYEKLEGKWSVVSYSYSKTGYESNLGFKTPRGSFLADLGKNKMLYKGSSGQMEGYAYYAVRFSGGGYLHGTPVTLEEVRNAPEKDVMRTREGFLGTIPGTRKCVRTTTDHAKFVYSWIFNKEDKTDKLPEYEKVKDNVLFIIY